MFRIVCLACCILAFFELPAAAKTYHVEKDGSGDYTVIQEAVDACAEGDTVWIGAGRFSEYRVYTYPSTDWNIYVNATVGELTIIGAGSDLTFIGPEDPGTWEPEDYVVGILSGPYIPDGPVIPDGLLRVEQLTVTDVIVSGVYVTDSGTVVVDNCSFVGGESGVRSYVSGSVSNCKFLDTTYGAVSTRSPAWGVSVDDCVMTNCELGFAFQATGEAYIRNCEIRDCGTLGGFDQSSGGMSNCEAIGSEWGLLVYGPGGDVGYEIVDNVIQGGWYNVFLTMDANNVTLERNILSESVHSAIRATNSLPTIHNNHILKGDGLAVMLVGTVGVIFPEVQHLDMSGNYWGTTETDSISAWISDGNDDDNSDCYGIVEFEPFSSVPLPEEKKSMGDLKSMFR